MMTAGTRPRRTDTVAPARLAKAGLQVRLVHGIERIAAAAWDACAGADDPFVSHRFLHALEASGSACARTGWQPVHVVVEDEGGEVVGAAPMYLKGHSHGEWVKDWKWADAYERAGGRYYPKLQVAVPFTPVPGPRLLVRPGPRAAEVERTLIGALIGAADQLDVSSLHLTFCTEAEWRRCGDAGLLRRTGVQYHWSNRGAAGFDDFLATLHTDRRKTIRKERARVREQGVTIEVLTGEAIRDEHWRVFYPFYRATVDKHRGNAYVTRKFFHRLGATMADRVVLVMARHGGRYVGSAVNLLGIDTLHTRAWGCLEGFPFLHFEVCNYAAIDFAIQRGLKRVEAGAGGRHKLLRGYAPVATYSAHYIRDPGLKRTVARFLAEERRGMAEWMEELNRFLPYRQDDGQGGQGVDGLPRGVQGCE